jgi:predicted RNA-binding protein with PUA-like domain
MNYWLVKSEPMKWSWDDQVKAGTTHWDGVRNAQATINLKAMRLGDLAFFYHSNEGKEIVGVVKIVREFYLDPNDETGKFGMVDVEAVEKLPRPVTLAAIKADPAAVAAFGHAGVGRAMGLCLRTRRHHRAVICSCRFRQAHG